MRKERQLTSEEQSQLEEFIEEKGLPNQSFHLVGRTTKRITPHFHRSGEEGKSAKNRSGRNAH